MVGLLGKMALGAAVGVAKGYGDSMSVKSQLEGKAAYDRMLLQTESGLRIKELAAANSFQTARDTANHTFTRVQNNKTRQANIIVAGSKGKRPGMMSDSQVYKAILGPNTVTDPMTGVKTTNWKASTPNFAIVATLIWQICLFPQNSVIQEGKVF